MVPQVDYINGLSGPNPLGCVVQIQINVRRKLRLTAVMVMAHVLRAGRWSLGGALRLARLVIVCGWWRARGEGKARAGVD